MLKVAQDRGIEVPEVKVPEPPKNEKTAEVELPEPPKDDKDDEKEDDKEDEENENEKKQEKEEIPRNRIVVLLILMLRLLMTEWRKQYYYQPHWKSRKNYVRLSIQ